MPLSAWGVSGTSAPNNKGDAVILPFDGTALSTTVQQSVKDADAQRCAYCSAATQPILEHPSPALAGLAEALEPFLEQIGNKLESTAVHHSPDMGAIPCTTELSPAEFKDTQNAMARALQELATTNPALRTCLQSYPEKEPYSQSKRLQCLAREIPAITKNAENTLQQVRVLLNVADHALQSSVTQCSCLNRP